MTHSEVAVKLIQSFEGCRLRAYRDQGGVLTIGWGHTGPEVVEGLQWTQKQADAALESDIGHFDLAMSVAIPDGALNQNQYDACISLMFNIGPGNFETSTVRRDILAGDMDGAANGFLLWDHVHGAVNPGLLRRRMVEKALFLTPTEAA